MHIISRFIKKNPIIVLIIIALLFFVPFLGSTHLFDWDEVNFAESAREMLVTGNYARVQINFHPFWEKPPLFFWLQAFSMYVFGVNDFAARFPNALVGMMTIVSFYLIGKKMHNSTFGFLWAICYVGSFLPHLYFKSAIIDPLFNYFIFMSIYFTYNSVENYLNNGKGTKESLVAGVFAGLATLTKGPVGPALIVITIFLYWVFTKRERIASFKSCLYFITAAVVVTLAWFGLEIAQNGIWFIEEFIQYHIRLLTTEDAGHGQPFYYHFVVVFVGCFPISVLALPLLWKGKQENLSAFYKWMLCLFWLVMILFSMVKTKIVHYSSLAYFPLSYMAVLQLYNYWCGYRKVKTYTALLLLVVGCAFSFLLIATPILFANPSLILSFVKDDFFAACLQTPVYWSGYEYTIGIGYLLIVLLSYWFIRTEKTKAALLLLFGSTALCVMIYTVSVVPKIEAHIQRPAINFYKSIKGKDVYVSTLYFKSYAHYYYFEIPKYNHPYAYYTTGQMNIDWLLNGEIDKPVYILVKANKAQETQARFPYLKIHKKEGAFVVFYRERVVKPK